MDPKLESVPIEVNDNTIRNWLNFDGRYPAVIPFQWREEFRIVGVNWAYALAWAAIMTRHFADYRWLNDKKLPDPISGSWPEKGSQTMRMEVKYLAQRFGEIMRSGEQEINQAEAVREYRLLQKLCADSAESTRPVPPETPAPSPVPAPLPPKPEPTPEKEPVKWPKIAAVIVPIITIALWVIPMPEWIKAIIRLILQAISG